jgi:hypothetical protein
MKLKFAWGLGTLSNNYVETYILLQVLKCALGIGIRNFKCDR